MIFLLIYEFLVFNTFPVIFNIKYPPETSTHRSFLINCHKEFV